MPLPPSPPSLKQIIHLTLTPHQNQQHQPPPQRHVSPEETSEFPSSLYCPIADEPPVNGVRFVIPDPNGVVNRQVFEYSQLFRTVFTTYDLSWICRFSVCR
jgi:hypothetical protein